MRRIRQLAMAAVMIAGTSETALAQWGRTPAGDYTYGMSYATIGSFSCWNWSFTVDSCSTSGSSATLVRDGVSLTFDFTGASFSTVAMSSASRPIVLGTMRTTLAGGPSFSPRPSTPVASLMFTLMLATTAPEATPLRRAFSVGITLFAGSADFGVYDNPFTHLLPPTAPRPNGFAPVVVQISDFDLRLPAYTGGATELTGRLGIVPEPSTYALFATGLLGLAAVARRKRKE